MTATFGLASSPIYVFLRGHATQNRPRWPDCAWVNLRDFFKCGDQVCHGECTYSYVKSPAMTCAGSTMRFSIGKNHRQLHLLLIPAHELYAMPPADYAMPRARS